MDDSSSRNHSVEVRHTRWLRLRQGYGLRYSVDVSKRSQFFRAGVGIMVARGNREVLVLRRVDTPSASWQMPQGGLKKGEEPDVAMWRELEEETGLTSDTCRLLAVSTSWLAYELPEAYRSSRVGRGQVQRWYLVGFSGQDSDIKPDGEEFNEWKWVGVEELVADVIPFRRPIYETLVTQFAAYLS